MKTETKEFFEFLKKSPTAFHAVENEKELLIAHGYTELKETEHWNVERGGKYFVTRNDSSLIALQVGTDLKEYGYRVAASHSDSPAFKVKENAQISVRGKYMQLNTEGYGGMICYTWFDRPLSLAGRVIVKENGKLKSRLFQMKRDLVLIPSVAIHMNRNVNEGMPCNKQIDLLPLFGTAEEAGEEQFTKLLAAELGVRPGDIYGKDVYLYNRMEPTVWGSGREFISAARLDDLQCAYASLLGFLDSQNDKMITVYACFDNEEVGSMTRQGAGSTFFQDTLQRINFALGFSQEDYYCAVARSFMLSEDNAHAVHPNHPEKTDVGNCVYMNEGIVIKAHAGQKYASDAAGLALCREISEKAGIPIQSFSNRSDEAGGSTLGNIAICRVPIPAVDIGLAQLAMHSAYETAGEKDTMYMKRFTEAFYIL